MKKSELALAIDRCGSINPEVREIGRWSLDALSKLGLVEARSELAHIVVSEDFVCSLAKADAVKVLINDLRRTGSAWAFLDLYHHGRGYVPDDLMFELLTLAAPNCTEAAEILEARLPGWRHPLA